LSEAIAVVDNSMAVEAPGVVEDTSNAVDEGSAVDEEDVNEFSSQSSAGMFSPSRLIATVSSFLAFHRRREGKHSSGKNPRTEYGVKERALEADSDPFRR
jgi:hypothetical protein